MGDLARTAIPTLTRRSLFRAGGALVAGFDLLPMLRPLNAEVSGKVNPRGSAKQCLFVFLQGGLSHVDSFDLKEGNWTPPDFAVKEVAPGVRMPTAIYPRLSARMNRIAIVRSLEAWETEHGRGTYYMHAAHPVSPARLGEIPSLGAVVAYEFRNRRKASDILPPFVSLNYGSDQVKNGFLDTRCSPLNLNTKTSLDFVVPDSERSRFQRRVSALDTFRKLDGATRTGIADQMDVLRRDSLTMMHSTEVSSILQMPDDDRKRYGSSSFGDACLLAKNVLAADRGTRFVSINHGGWDFHTNIFDKDAKSNFYSQSKELDSGLSELLTDMEATPTPDGSSLLDQTLVVVVTEFGRTPGDITVGKGRDHFRFAFSGLFAGAGVKGGRAIGATDSRGEKVTVPGWSKKRSIYPEDIGATIYSALGIDWTTRITNTPSGRFFEYIEPQSGTNFLALGELSELYA